MVKKILAVATAILMLCCMVPLAAFADDVLDVCPKCGERTYETWNDCTSSIPDIGLPLSCKRRHCTSCQYTYYDWNCMGFTGYKDFDSGSGNLIADYLKEWKDKTFGKNASAKKYETGGGSAGTGGVGRRPSGYSENDKPNVSNTGLLHFYAPVTGWTRGGYNNGGCYFWRRNRIPGIEVPSANATGTKFPSSFSSDDYVMAVCAFTAPVSGTYSTLPGNVIGKYRYLSGGWHVKEYISNSATGGFVKGDSAYLVAMAYTKCLDYPYDAVGYGVDIYVVPLESAIKPSNSITINQNVWNGNIYQDNSTNLTYIYPQYTTINENNETVTNISNNPIIYNNETKQYYTYDTVTNNYYYITYEAPTPSPSPDPTPTPTPEPGGDTGDTTGILAVLVEIRDNMVQGFLDLKATLVQGWADLSANFTLAIENLNINIKNYFDKKLPDQSTPETAKPSPSPSPSPEPSPSPTPDPGETPTPTPAPTDKPSGGNTNNFWNFVFPGGNDDGTENGHKGILWALISLLIAVVTFVLGLGSAYAYVFPFLPAGLVTTIHICVLVLLLFAIIKFVRSFL